jgi:ADP-ribose pyrophosphatase YjhB (NUDIX family)
MTAPRPRFAVGALVFDASGRVLLIQRGKPPAEGRWSLPGGHVEWGEPLAAACRREVWEETGLRVSIGPLVELVERIGQDHHFVIADYLGQLDPSHGTSTVAGEPTAGGDARAARWVAMDELSAYPTTEGLAPVVQKGYELWRSLRPPAP